MSAPVVFLEDSDDMRILLTRLLHIKFDLECRCFATYEDFTATPEELLQAKLFLLDINLGESPKSGIDAYHWLRSHEATGKICFLTGHATQHPLVTEAKTVGALVLEKPITPSLLDQVVYETFPEKVFSVFV
jgi:FixJ family two-component response regulator